MYPLTRIRKINCVDGVAMENRKCKTDQFDITFLTNMKMEALQQSLSPLNWSLVLTGFPLFKSTNKYIRVVVDAYGCFLVIANIFAGCSIYFWNLSESSSFLLLLVFRIWDISYMALAVSTYLIIWSARKGVLRILRIISTLLSNEDRKKLHFLSLVLFVYKILFMLVFQSQYVSSLYDILCRSWREGWWLFLPSIVQIIIQLQDWELIIICVFITLLKTIHLAETNVMKILNQDLAKVEPKVLYRQLHKVLSLKEHFMECVSFLPLFLYCYIFIDSVCCIVMLNASMDNSSESKGRRLMTILLNTRNILMVSHSVLLTLYTHHLSCQSRSQLKKMEYEIHTKHDHLLKKSVMKMIEESKRYEYRAGDFFVINKELLLSFFSAFVTFTVLFVQLINQYI